MLKMLGAAVLAAHGLVHLIGFVVPFGIAEIEGYAHRTTALGGVLALGDPGARLVGVAWLLLAAGFVVAAVAVWRGRAWALPLAAALAAASIVVCVLGLPETVGGIAVNVAILGIVAWVLSTRRATAGTAG